MTSQNITHITALTSPVLSPDAGASFTFKVSDARFGLAGESEAGTGGLRPVHTTLIRLDEASLREESFDGNELEIYPMEDLEAK